MQEIRKHSSLLLHPKKFTFTTEIPVRDTYFF